MISNSTIENVRDAAIADVVGHYLQLKITGSGLTASCPFHDEKSASFSVNVVKNYFKCFGCGAGGDAIEFVRKKENLSFAEAVIKVADICGYTVEYDEKPTQEMKDEAAKKEELYALADWTANRFIEALGTHAEGMKYWTDRGFSEATIAEWRLGYAPAGFHYMTDKLKETGRLSLAAEIDVVKRQGDRSYDTYIERAMVPIQNHLGRVIGFGGRIIEKESKFPKYINPGETPLYHKSKVLFGLNRAIIHIRKINLAILTEGYTDVIRLHEYGEPIAVASCGTALTQEQAKLLKKYCSRVIVMRDGDKAGQAAAVKDVMILLREKFDVYVCMMPDGEDPDSFFRDGVTGPRDPEWIEKTKQDAVVWHAGALAGKITDISSKADAQMELLEMLELIGVPMKRTEYMKAIAPMFKMKHSELEKLYTKKQTERETVRKMEAADEEGYPKCFNIQNIHKNGFDQLDEEADGHGIGIYFPYAGGGGVFRVTNFTINPLYHIIDENNGRRMVELYNGRSRSTVEMNDRAMTSLDAFELACVSKAPYYTYAEMMKAHFKRLAGWMMLNVRRAYEMTTLGWQPEGFWAFADKVVHNGQFIDYNDRGAVEINEMSYISMGVSSAQSDYRQEQNQYENDLYLKFKQSPVVFKQWAKLFNDVYPANGMYGIVYVLITLYKDIIRNSSNKVPHLFCYGTKGSGKSDFAESITWLFFSGKDAEGNLKPGFNLNPGQSTPFSFFNLLARFRNCPVLLNEFNEQEIEEYKFGALKAAFDGEGREVGDGSTGKKRKTKIDKVQGTCIIVGQYLSGKDDGSLLSRSIPLQFVESYVKSIDDTAKDKHRQLKDFEKAGLSSIIADLLAYRDQVKLQLPMKFNEEYKKLHAECKRWNVTPESRILKNFSLCNTLVKIFAPLVELPFTYEEFYERTLKDVLAHNRMIKDTSILNGFWKVIEYMFDEDMIKYGQYYEIKLVRNLRVVEDRETVEKDLGEMTQVLFVRFDSLHQAYSVEQRRRTGKVAMDESTMKAYLKDQSYYIGLVSIYEMNDKRSSAYALRYDGIGVLLQKGGTIPAHQVEDKREPAEQKEMPF